MKRMTVLYVVLGSLLGAGSVQAETIGIQITRDKTKDPLSIQAGDQFTIKVERVAAKDKGDFFDIQVTVKQRSPVAEISVPGVKVTSRGGERTYSFRVSAKDMEIGTFTYSEELTSAGGYYYWFRLKDFAPSK